MIRTCTLLLLLCGFFSANAATIKGTIRDSKDSSVMIGVIISIEGTERSAQSDIDGHYEFHDVPDGAYTLHFNYVSYKKQTASIVVASNTDLSQDVIMTATGNQLKGTTVRTTRRTGTETAVLTEIRKSNLVVSGISSAQISKTMDRNAADVVKRIPGVTIQDDRFITIRGLAARYNSVWLNDAGAPSSEADKKAFSFDIIPSGLIDRILIFKTPSPELPGDFAGGMVKVYTTSIPDKNTYTLGVSSSYRAGSTGTEFFHNQKSSTDWLGYDNGVRSLPSLVTDEYVKTDQGNNRDLSKSFGNDFQIFSKKQPLDLRLNASASNVFKFSGFKIGSTLGLSYSNTATNYVITRLDYNDTVKAFNNNDLQSSTKANVGALANFAVEIGNSKIEFRNLYNQIGTATVVNRTSNIDAFASREGDEHAYSMGYESRATYSAQLGGTHHNNSDTRKYTWTLGYSDLFKNQPDLRMIKYGYDEVAGKYIAKVSNGKPDMVNGGGRYYSTLFENIYSFSHQFTQKVKIGNSFDFDINAGNYIEYKKRSFTARELGYSLTVSDSASQSLLYLPVNQIFANENIGGEGQFKVSEVTSDYDRYSANNRLIASYISVVVPITSRIKIVTGVRYEDNLYKLTAYRFPDTLSPEIKTKFFLPSLNATYNFSDKSLLRLAYGKTVNRPEFRETAPFYYSDFDRKAGIYGAAFQTAINPNGDTLDVAQIHNLDLRYEYYPSAGEVIQIGGFYKHFKDPIQQVNYNLGGRNFTYINAASAYVYGLEIDIRKNLGMLDDRFNTKGVFSNLTLVGNLALSKSELKIDTVGRSILTRFTPTSPLEGQSNYVVNAGFFYQSDSLGLQASLLYNVYGPRAYSIGNVDDGSIGELAFHSLDFTFAKTIYKHYQINVGVQNLLDQAYQFVLDGNKDQKFKSDDFLYSKFKPGRYFTVGLRVRF